jgi:hypothetical protein
VAGDGKGRSAGIVGCAQHSIFADRALIDVSGSIATGNGKASGCFHGIRVATVKAIRLAIPETSPKAVPETRVVKHVTNIGDVLGNRDSESTSLRSSADEVR